MLHPSLGAPLVRPSGHDPAARIERTLLGAAMSVMAFVLERRLAQGPSRGRSLASS